ncbi:MAG: histidine phosphatase family protein [Anaerolineae bacterium]
MQLYYIRHAESENNRLWAETGSGDGRSPDPHLTALGHRQARRLAEFIRDAGEGVPQEAFDLQNVHGFGFTHLYCSLMVRAVETALPLAHALDLPLVGWKDLHEGGGIFLVEEREKEEKTFVGLPGRSRSYFEAHYPELRLPEDLGEEGWWNRPFETREERPLRARRVLHTLLERHGGTEDRVALISHGGFYNHLLRAVLDMPDSADHWLVMNNVAITRIDFLPETINVVYTNRLDYLPSDMIT